MNISPMNRSQEVQFAFFLKLPSTYVETYITVLDRIGERNDE